MRVIVCYTVDLGLGVFKGSGKSKSLHGPIQTDMFGFRYFSQSGQTLANPNRPIVVWFEQWIIKNKPANPKQPILCYKKQIPSLIFENCIAQTLSTFCHLLRVHIINDLAITLVFFSWTS